MLPNTILVTSPRRITVLLFVATQGIAVGLDRTFWGPVGDYFDKNLAKVKVENHMQCLVKCLANSGCRSYMSRAVPASPLSGFRCFIDESPSGAKMKFEKIVYICTKATGPRENIPQVIAGACSNHNCTRGKVCEPISTGKYRCNKLNVRKQP